jgi:DNA processing protein
MGKKIFVLPHRLDESRGTNSLLAGGLAKPIYDIESFSDRYGVVPKDNSIIKDDFFYFCQTSPTFDEAIAKFGSRVYEAELEEIITISNGLVQLK